MGIALWIIQGLLALMFAVTGLAKLLRSRAALTEHVRALSLLPTWFIRFIGAAELLAAFGLILPAATRIAPVLTPAAAAGLVPLMVGATVLNAARRKYRQMGTTVVLLLLAAVVLYGRLVLVPIAG
jgi:hypothetical protein